MTAPAITVADAMVTAITGAALSMACTAKRSYVPKFELSGDGLEIQVVPKSDAREAGGQSEDAAEIAIDVGVKKKLAILDQTTDALREAAEIAECDTLLNFCEEIKGLFNRERVAGAVCYRIEQNPIYSVEKIDNGRVFITAITFIFSQYVSI